MKWFKGFFNKNQEASMGITKDPSIRGLNRPKMLSARGVGFTLYYANGGTVVELIEYDSTTDRVHNALYVIPSDKDLGEQLGYILTTEALKK